MKWVGIPSVYSAIRIGKTVYQVSIMLFYFKIYINKLSLVMLSLCFLVKTQTGHAKRMHKHQVLRASILWQKTGKELYL